MDRYSDLTAQMIVLGYKNEQIAQKLNCSIGTIKRYIKKCYNEFKAKNRADFVRKYMVLNHCNEI